MSEPARRRIEPYLSRLFGYALSLTRDRDGARDLVQDCALKALGAARVPYHEAAYRAWLFRILRNAFLDRARRRNDAPIAIDEAALPDMRWDYDDRLISVLTVRLGLAKLSEAHREVIAVVDIGGFSYAEAADFLEVPIGTVMSRLSRARRALLHAISDGKVQPLPVDGRRAVK